MNAHERMPKGTRFSLLAVGIGLTWLLLPVLSFAQVAPVVQFSFSGAHSAGPVTGTFTLDRLNGVLTDFDVMTPFFHYTPSNTLFVASDQPGGFTVSLLVLPFTNAPRYLNLSFAGSVETFNGGGTIPRVDILVNGQSNIAYFLTQEQFQGVYTVSGSAQINTDQMTPFSYGIALGCLSRSAVQGVCDEGSSKNAQVAHDGIASMNSTYVGPTSPQAQLAFNAIGGSGYGALRARATDSFDISSTPAIAYGAGIGEFRDVLTVDSPPFTGQTGLLLVQYILVGNISASNAIAFTEVLVDVYGPYFTNLQEISAVHSCVFPLQTCSVGALFTVQKFFRFVYGQPFALEFALVAQSGTTSPGPTGRGYVWTSSTGLGSGAADFSNTLVIAGMEFFDSNGNPLPSVPSIVSASGTPYSVNGALVSFADYSAQLELGKKQGNFEVEESFMLGTASNGINPPDEDVGFQIGTFSSVIPAGSFKTDAHGRFRFEGVLNSVSVEAVIEPLGGGKFRFRAEGHGANLAGMLSPVKMKLIIGDDGGTSIVTLN